MNIYHIQDADRPMYVLAISWTQALAGWKQLITEENSESDMSSHEPDGIALVAESDDVLQISAEWKGSTNGI